MKVKTVTSYYARIKGLLGTRQHQLDFDALHIIPCKGIHTFGMKYAIDLAFLDAQGKVISLRTNIAPNRVCPSPLGTKSVLERPAGKAFWLSPGDYIASSIEHVIESEKTKE